MLQSEDFRRIKQGSSFIYVSPAAHIDVDCGCAAAVLLYRLSEIQSHRGMMVRRIAVARQGSHVN
jgi:hypothetical protein